MRSICAKLACAYAKHKQSRYEVSAFLSLKIKPSERKYVMKLKEILIGAVAVVLVALVAVGATLAYLTATDEVTNVMTVGDVDIELLEFERVDAKTKGDEAAVQEFVDDKLLMPPMLADGFDYASPDATIKWDEDKDGNAIKPGYTSNIWDPEKISRVGDKMVFVKSTSSHTDAYVRLYFAFEAGNYTSFTRFKNMIHLNLNETEWTWEWNKDLADIRGTKYFIACATYYKAISPDEITAISLSQIALDPTATNGDAIAFGDKYDILVVGQAIQSGAFADAKQALDEGFGTEPPFRGIAFEEGVTLHTALHYLNGVESEENKITSKVATVTFGLYENYPNVVRNEATFIGAEQDVPVHAYYLPNSTNGDNYDVYVIADSAIYTPKDSTGLFQGMTSLTTVDTTNMDVSRTEDMTEMFCNCPLISDLDVSEWDVSNNKFLRCAIDSDGNGSIDTYNYKLTSLDVSKWNTKSATDMSYMFHGCRALTSLNVSGWNVGNVSLFTNLFAFCNSLTSFDVEGWDTSKAINMNYMFCECVLLTELDLSRWNVSTVQQTGAMFEKCTALEKLNVSTWDVRNVFEMGVMFRRCEVLQELDLSQWKTDSLLRTNNMFDSCYMLKNIHFGDGWNMSKTTKTYGMFNNCKVLTYLDVSEWSVSNVVDMNTMFSNCGALTSLNVSKWNTSNVTNMKYMFNGCELVPELDVSGWDTANVTNMEYMFSGCKTLSSLDVSNFDTSNVTNMKYMFNGCALVPELDVSNWNTAKVTTMEYMFSGCKTLSSLDVSNFDTSGVTTMKYMFNGCELVPELDVSDWNTAKVTTMEYMFNGCALVPELDVSGWNTAKVTTMKYMFKDCVGLTELDLGNWNTNALKNSEQMFAGCSNLQKIYVGVDWSTAKITAHGKMFENCTSLVGGNGTVYNSKKINKEYARIDNAPDAPGYLTQGPAPANP